MRHRTIFELILIWTLTLLVPAIGDGGVTFARCRSTCLSAHFTSSTLHTNSSSLLEECSRNLNCSSCIYPCKKHYKSLDTCKAKCQEAVSAPDICIESCTYVKQIKYDKIGACPLTLAGFEQACVEECADDRDCKGGKKCCDNGCGRTCQTPHINRRDYPPRVDRRGATVTENEDRASATVRWRGATTVAMTNWTMDSDQESVILYAVQAKNVSESRSKVSWFDVGVVEKPEISVPLQVGRDYKFRVASVNQNGTLGFFRPTPDFSLSRAPSKPGPPHSIETGSWQVIDTRIHMSIHWSPPKQSDLEISKYRVFYSERRAVLPDIIALEEHRLDVPGSETSCILPNLLPDLKYFIQVKAIARFGDTRLSSARDSAYIYTPNNRPNDDQGHKPLPVDPFLPETLPSTGPLPGPPRELTSQSPYLENNSLKVRLSWRKPKDYEETVNRFTLHWEATVCSSGSGEDGQATIQGSDNNDIYTPYRQKAATTHDTHFELYGLSFDCTYEVWVKPVYNQVWGPAAATIQILTPPCTEVEYRGLRPVCPTPVPDIPSAPLNMTYSYSIGETISAYFSWAPPARSLHPLKGYRILWAQVKPSSGLTHAKTPTIEREEFHSELLREMQTSYTITDLTAGARYVVKLYALSSIGGGAIVAVDIKTPNIRTVTPVIPGSRPRTPPAADDEIPNPTIPTHNHAAEFVGSSLLVTLLVILSTCHVIQR